MENRIKSYEKFINVATQHPTKELRDYHREMLQNFQHERLIHLIVTLFFATLALIMVPISVYSLSLAFQLSDNWLLSISCVVVATVLIILTCFYVKHYYFLENHIQKLYDVSRKLAAVDNK